MTPFLYLRSVTCARSCAGAPRRRAERTIVRSTATGGTAMRTRAAVVDEGSRDFEVRELEVDEPGPGEVHVRFVASGLCHSDLHLLDGDLKPRYQIVAGHEGSGIV